MPLIIILMVLALIAVIGGREAVGKIATLFGLVCIAVTGCILWSALPGFRIGVIGLGLAGFIAIALFLIRFFAEEQRGREEVSRAIREGNYTLVGGTPMPRGYAEHATPDPPPAAEPRKPKTITMTRHL